MSGANAAGHDPAPNRRLAAALFLASAALIALQVVLMQGYAQAQGHHLAFVVISLALLGFGSSGAVLSLARERLLAGANAIGPGVLAAAAIACVVGLPLALRWGAAIDLPLLFVDARAWLPLVAAAALTFLPFFFGALFLGLVFVRDVDQIGARYAANLLGSASGAGCGLLVLYLLPPEQVLPLLALPLLAAAALLLTIGHGAKGTGFRWRGWQLGLFGLAAVASVLIARHEVAPPMSPYKAIQYSLRLPGARISADSLHPAGRLQIVAAPALRYGPGLSLGFRGEIPPAPHLYRNGDGYGALPGSVAGANSRVLDFSVQGLPLAIARPRRALVLPAAGGVMIDYLLAHGVPSITAVEPHPAAARLLRSLFAEAVAAGRLSVETAEPRAWMQGRHQPFDLIVQASPGSFGGGLGLQALQEDYLLTVEAYRALFSLLDADGVFAVSVWIDQPPRHSLRLLATLAAARQAAGGPPLAGSLLALRSWEMLTLVVGARPFGEAERAAFVAFADRRSFDQAWPARVGAAAEEFNRLADDRLRDGFAAILGGRGDAFAAAYPFALAPTHDDAPYFHQFIRWNHVDEVRHIFGANALGNVEMGSVLVAATTVLLAIAAVLLIVAPLAARGWERGGRLPVFAYFSALGLGFMFLEIVWIQRFTLYWGHPLYSAAGVITAILCGMGIGSAASRRLATSRRALPAVLALLAVVALVSLPAFAAIFAVTLAWPLWAKGVLGVVLVGVPAVGLGLPFPLAMRAVGANFPAQVPWAWAINGCFSVLAAPLAALIALQSGFSAVGAGAAAAYLLAALVAWRWAVGVLDFGDVHS